MPASLPTLPDAASQLVHGLLDLAVCSVFHLSVPPSHGSLYLCQITLSAQNVLASDIAPVAR